MAVFYALIEYKKYLFMLRTKDIWNFIRYAECYNYVFHIMYMRLPIATAFQL